MVKEQRASVPTTYVVLALEQLAETPDVLSAILSDTSFDPAGFDPSAPRMPMAQQLALVKSLERVMGPSWAVDLTKLHRTSGHGALDLMFRSAPDVRAGLEALVHFLPLRAPYLDADLTQSQPDKQALLRFRGQAEVLGSAITQVLELALVGTVNLLRQTDPDLVKASRIEVTWAMPGYAAAFEAACGVPVSFAAAETGLWLDGAILARPLPSADSNLYQALSQQLEQELAQLSGSANKSLPALRAAVRALIQAGDLSKLALASRLGYSERSLTRVLAGEKTTFRRERDLALADALEEACQTDKPNWPDLALALGFSDVSSLNRFCQRNFKMSLGQLALRSRARDPEN